MRSEEGFSPAEAAQILVMEFATSVQIGQPPTMPSPSCQDLILASLGDDLRNALRFPIEASMEVDAGRYQGQALV